MGMIQAPNVLYTILLLISRVERGGVCMTLERLNEHRDLVVKLHRVMEMIGRLREKAEPHSPSLTGMPHGSGVGEIGRAHV